MKILEGLLFVVIPLLFKMQPFNYPDFMLFLTPPPPPPSIILNWLPSFRADTAFVCGGKAASPLYVTENEQNKVQELTNNCIVVHFP